MTDAMSSPGSGGASGATSLPGTLAGELETTPVGPGRERRDVSEFWIFADRIFGGYAAALVLAAAARASGHPVLLSAHVMFLRPTHPGPVELQTEVVRPGRGTSAVRAVSVQDGDTRVSVDALFASAEALGTGPLDAASPPPPPECPLVDYWDVEFPFMRAFEERAVDYPASIEAFWGGPPRVELWSRWRFPLGSEDPLVAQLADVFVLDAHLLDAPVRARTDLSLDAFSLDLALWWYSSAPRTAWVRVVTEAEGPGSGFAPATGGVWSENGALRVRAAQQGRLYDARD